jgi:hypothetical protein
MLLTDRSRWQHYTDSAPEHKLEETLSLCATADDTKPMILLLDGNARTQSEKAGGDLAHLSSDKKVEHCISLWEELTVIMIGNSIRM